MKFGRDAVPSGTDHSMLEGALATDEDATEVALSAEEKEDTQTETAEKDDESAGDDFPASAPSHPTVAMPVVRDLIPPTPITLDEPEGSDDDLEDCGGEWMRGLPPPPPTQPPVDAEADDAPTELSEPMQTRGTVATQETTTTAAIIQDGGTRRTARASTATAETVVTRPRRAAANATASTAAAETAAKPKKAAAEQVKPTTAEQTKANAKAPAKQAPEKSKPIQRRGRSAVMPDETQEATKPKKAAVEQVAPTSAAKAKTPAKAPATRAPEKTRPTSKRGRAAVGTEETQDDTPGRMTKTQKAAVETVAPTSAAKAKAPAKRAPAKPKPTSKRGRAAVSPDDKQDDTHDTKKSKTRRGGEPFGSVKKKEFCVLVSTAFDPETAEKLTRKVLKLGGVCTVSSSEFTHFLTAPPLGRSKNVLSALASGSPVVLPSWLDASVRISHLPHSADWLPIQDWHFFLQSQALAGAFVAAETHLCRHALFEKKQGFDLPQTLELARFAPLFQQVNAFVIPPVGGKRTEESAKTPGGSARSSRRRGADTKEMDNEKEDLQDQHAEPAPVGIAAMLREVLPRAGAVLVDKEETIETVADDVLSSKEGLIVTTPESDPATVARMKKRGVSLATHEAVMSAIVRHKR
jgi:hypothetical protein